MNRCFNINEEIKDIGLAYLDLKDQHVYDEKLAIDYIYKNYRVNLKREGLLLDERKGGSSPGKKVNLNNKRMNRF